jgi:GT2 family glycosyltransferase
MTDTAADPDWPDVDVVMPIRNEAEHLASAVAAVRAQDYPGKVRIFLGVGPSSDGTERVAGDLASRDDDLFVVSNPSGRTPSALNAALRAGSAPIVARVDGHSELSDGYIRRAVETMRRTKAANVGGRQVPVANTPFEEAVAAATTSWLGTGGASYRVGGQEGPVDTVYLGVFDRSAIEAVGLFDERLVRNQDYELNIRLRKAGETVWFDPELWVGYQPRGSWRSLARQYFEYGQWKAVVMCMHPESARLRQLGPPIAAVLAVAITGGTRRGKQLASITGAVVSVMIIAQHLRPDHLARNRRALVTLTLQTAWATGFLVSTARLAQVAVWDRRTIALRSRWPRCRRR